MVQKKRKIFPLVHWRSFLREQALIDGKFIFTSCPFNCNPQFVLGYGSTLSYNATLSLLRFDTGHKRGAFTKAHWNIDGSYISNYGDVVIAQSFRPESHVQFSVPAQFSTKNLPQEKQEEINKFQQLILISA